MANEKKMTKAVAWGIVRGIVKESGHPKTEELLSKIDNELGLLEKKNSSEKKPTATQVANEGLKQSIVEGVEANRVYTIGELVKEIPACAELSTSKMSALLRQLIDAGKVVRTEDKRKAYFSLA
jgi:hypothetical protein